MCSLFRLSARWGHAMAVVAEERPYRDSDNSVPPEPILLGARCRAVAAGPYRDSLPPRWQAAVAYAAVRITAATVGLEAGLWEPAQDVCSAAAAVHPTLMAGPDLEAPPLPSGYTELIWIQRAVHIEHVHTTIRTVLLHHKDAGHSDALFGAALRAVSVALVDVLPTVQELERLWVYRQVTVGEWEQAHIPRALREHLVALEGLISQLCQLVFGMIVDPEEPY